MGGVGGLDSPVLLLLLRSLQAIFGRVSAASSRAGVLRTLAVEVTVTVGSNSVPVFGDFVWTHVSCAAGPVYPVCHVLTSACFLGMTARRCSLGWGVGVWASLLCLLVCSRMSQAARSGRSRPAGCESPPTQPGWVGC